VSIQRVDPSGVPARYRSLLTPGLVEQAAGARHIRGGLDHPGQIEQRDRPLGEATGATVDAQATAAGDPDDPGTLIPALDPAVSLRSCKKRLDQRRGLVERAVGEAARCLAAPTPDAPGGIVDGRQ